MCKYRWPRRTFRDLGIRSIIRVVACHDNLQLLNVNKVSTLPEIGDHLDVL